MSKCAQLGDYVKHNFINKVCNLQGTKAMDTMIVQRRRWKFKLLNQQNLEMKMGTLITKLWGVLKVAIKQLIMDGFNAVAHMA